MAADELISELRGRCLCGKGYLVKEHWVPGHQWASPGTHTIRYRWECLDCAHMYVVTEITPRILRRTDMEELEALKQKATMKRLEVDTALNQKYPYLTNISLSVEEKLGNVWTLDSVIATEVDALKRLDEEINAQKNGTQYFPFPEFK
jgi:hypothetical protein